MRISSWFVGLLLPACLLLPGCEEGTGAPPTRAGEPVPVFREFRGQQGPFADRGFFVIQRQEAWQALWSPQQAPENIDFTRQTVLVALMGRQPTAGYSINIADVRATGQQINVYITEERPAPGDPVAQVITYPYHMVVTPKLTQPVNFIVEGSEEQPIGIQEQYTGQQSEVVNARTIVVRTQDAWRREWAAAFGAAATPPEVDFGQYVAVGVFIGRRPTAGYAVRITSVDVVDERIRVNYIVRSPEPDDPVAQVITSPFAIAIIPISQLPVAFRNVTPQSTP